jgi:predicted lipid-binding transport protein (Tim44 family)
MATGHHGGEDLREQSIGELLKQLSQETTTLVKQELDLAKAEMTQKGKQAGLGAGFLGGGAVMGLGAFGAFTAFLIALLATAVDHTWLAALIVTVVYGAIAGFLALRGKNELQEATPPAPQQTVETLKEDVEWAKTQTRSGAR